MKPSVHWVGGLHADVIWSNLRHQFGLKGYPEAPAATADIVCFSAGDPFWADPGHPSEFVQTVLHGSARVMIVERHEYGWCNYASGELRVQNAWLGVADYGRDTDVSGGRHAAKHESLARLCREIEPSRLLYFRREYFRGFPYPDFVHPINFHLGPVPKLATFEEFRKRPLDLMCVWGETHDHRRIVGETLKRGLAEGWLRGDVRSPVYAGMPGRLPGGEGYRQPHERARMFVTADGHGLGGGREWELVTTALMVRKRSWMVIPNEFEHGLTCLQWGGANDPDPEGLVELLRAWKDREADLYRVFEAGYHHAVRYHTAEARADYAEERMRDRGWT